MQRHALQGHDHEAEEAQGSGLISPADVTARHALWRTGQDDPANTYVIAIAI